MRSETRLGVVACIVAAVAACNSNSTAVGYPWSLNEYFPAPPVPPNNAMSASKALLGRYLFYDVRLSGNQTYSCASCHQQARAFTDGRAQAIGSTGQALRRSTMSLTNVAYNTGFTWCNPALATLEQQIIVPLFNEEPVELGLAGREDDMLARLEADAQYPTMFQTAFPGDPAPISLENVILAITTFERTLISNNSPYDQYVAGNTSALSASAIAGKELFFGERLECYHCHGGFNLTDDAQLSTTTMPVLNFQNTGLYNLGFFGPGGTGMYPPSDQGLIEFTGVASDMGSFRAPTLHNIALTAPYMHDGSIDTLEHVITQHYEQGGRTIATGANAGDGFYNPYKNSLIRGYTLTDQELQDTLAFLNSFTDMSFVTNPAFSNPFSSGPSATQGTPSM